MRSRQKYNVFLITLSLLIFFGFYHMSAQSQTSSSSSSRLVIVGTTSTAPSSSKASSVPASSKAASSFSSITYAAGSSTISVAIVDVYLYWPYPQERENGRPLALVDVGGYVLEYRKKGVGEWIVIDIPSGLQNSFTLAGIPNVPHEFRVRAYDLKRLYSQALAVVPEIRTDRSRPAMLGLKACVISPE